MSFHSTFQDLNPTVKQTLYFCGGQIRTIKGIITSEIKQSEYTELTCTNGVTWNISPKDVNYFTTESEGDKSSKVLQKNEPNKIYHFRDGSKATVENIYEIKEGEFTKLTCTNGVIWSINPDNVIAFEDIPEGVETKEDAQEVFYKDYLEYFKPLDSNLIKSTHVLGFFSFPNGIIAHLNIIDSNRQVYSIFFANDMEYQVETKTGLMGDKEDILQTLEELKNIPRDEASKYAQANYVDFNN